jgi:peptidoglycan/xylan/chitin deacetylase (PgdA/CDA1 family)
VGITFDDGFASDYEEAFPALLAEGARADFFVNTANVGTSEYLNWSQIREMHRGGMGIHSHGHSHAALSLLSVDSLRRELNTSRNLLEDQLGSSVEFIAAPYGLVNRRVIHEALAAGYRGVCRSRQWPARPGNKCINRVTVYRRTSPEEFDDLLTCRPGPYIRRLMRSVVIYCPKKLLVRFQPKLVGVIVQEEPT